MKIQTTYLKIYFDLCLYQSIHFLQSYYYFYNLSTILLYTIYIYIYMYVYIYIYVFTVTIIIIIILGFMKVLQTVLT